MIRSLQRELKELSRTRPKLRQGRVTAVDPLKVSVGGNTAVTARGVGGHLVVGAQVQVLQHGSDLLVIGSPRTDMGSAAVTNTLSTQTTISSATETTLVSSTGLTAGTYFAIGQVDWLSVPSGSTFGVYLYVDNSMKSRLYVAGAISRSGLTVAWAGSVTGTIDLRAARPSGTGSADASTASRLTILRTP